MTDVAKGVETIRKILALISDEGATDGEKQSAQSRLDELLKKYNLSLDDIQEVEQIESYEFTYHSRAERKLQVQCAYLVLGDAKKIKTWSYKRSRSKWYFDMKPSEYIQMKIVYEHYWALLQSEIDFLLDVFIQKHRLFGLPSGEIGGREMTDDEYEKLRKMRAALQDSANPLVTKQLEGA